MKIIPTPASTGFLLKHSFFNCCIIFARSTEATPRLIFKRHKNIQNCKIKSRNFTYDGLTFSSSFWLFEEVKDEIFI